MSKKPETRLKEKVLHDLKLLPNLYVVKIQQTAIHGTPDLLICCRGLFIAIELKKSPQDKPEPRQQYDLDKISEAGGIALTADPLTWPHILAKLSVFASCQVKLLELP